jgi:two-component system response regulator PilR (NtrC family)
MQPNITALVVDDEPDIRELLQMALSGMGVRAYLAASLGEAKRMLAEKQLVFCLTDMRLPDGSGLDLVEQISSADKQMPVAVITAFGSVEMAVEAMKKGAFDFVNKPIELDQLRRLVEHAVKLATAKPASKGSPGSRKTLLGESASMRELREKINRLSRSRAPVHISGESGTGKELVARLIHASGAEPEAPFVAVNCGAIPSELVESELFGCKKGAFTGAVGDREGLFQAAAGGTLFLDEVAELPQSTQVKLLRVLQEKRVLPVGGRQEETVDVRVLSATNSDLAELVRLGRFREDLYYRINVIELRIPPLRERSKDIPLLAENILSKLADENDVPAAELSAGALQALCAYRFPGNVRELENLLERAATLSAENVIMTTDLGLPESERGDGEAGSAMTAEASVEVGLGEQSDLRQEGLAGERGCDLEAELQARERELITAALEQTRWNRTAAAKKLGITFRALRYRLKKLGLD